MDVLKIFLLIFIFIVFVEGTVEYTFGQFFEHFTKKHKCHSWILRYAATFLALALVLFYKLDLVSTLLFIPVTYEGIIITGVFIGRMSNYINNIVSRHLLKKQVPIVVDTVSHILKVETANMNSTITTTENNSTKTGQ